MPQNTSTYDLYFSASILRKSRDRCPTESCRMGARSDRRLMIRVFLWDERPPTSRYRCCPKGLAPGDAEWLLNPFERSESSMIQSTRLIYITFCPRRPILHKSLSSGDNATTA